MWSQRFQKYKKNAKFFDSLITFEHNMVKKMWISVY
jgi:hypothetical protein